LSVVEVAPKSEAAQEVATLVSSITQVQDRRQAA
jgi:hypothetical protein